MVTWWEKCVKREISFLSSIKWLRDLGNLYEILKKRTRPREETPTLKQLKFKIVWLHSTRLQFTVINTHEVTLFRVKTLPFSIPYKCGKAVCSGWLPALYKGRCKTNELLGAFCTIWLSFCKANVILFRRNMRVLIERRMICIGTYRLDGGTF